MACIDKTYTDSYEDYKQFKDWADKQVITFFNGYKVCIGNSVWNYEKEDFLYGEIPIMNTPTWLDIYLIQNCKSEFVLDRMKDVYGENEYNKFKTVDLTAKPPEEFQQNRKITIKHINKRTKYPLHNKPYSNKPFNSRKWLLQSNYDFSYHEESKTWTPVNNYYPYNTNTADFTSIKAVIKHLRKQYLPKGVTFNICGRYIGEDYLVTVS